MSWDWSWHLAFSRIASGLGAGEVWKGKAMEWDSNSAQDDCVAVAFCHFAVCDAVFPS